MNIVGSGGEGRQDNSVAIGRRVPCREARLVAAHEL